jgi:hypothetical protein
MTACLTVYFRHYGSTDWMTTYPVPLEISALRSQIGASIILVIWTNKTILLNMLLCQYKLRIPSSNNINRNAKFIENPTIWRKYIKKGGQKHIDGTYMENVFFL